MAFACSLMLVGCTIYGDCASREDRILARYDQNIIKESDGRGYAIWKGVKHGFFDVITLCICEFWYAKVRSSYCETERYVDEESVKYAGIGQKSLDDFLGIRLGEKFAHEKNAAVRFGEGEKANRISFQTNRRFVDAPKFKNWVTLTDDGRVYEIESVAFFYTDESMERARKWDREHQKYSINATAFSSGCNTVVEGDITSVGSAAGRLLRLAWSTADAHVPQVVSMLERKYGKPVIRQGTTDYIIPFENGRQIKFSAEFGMLRISALDCGLRSQVIQSRAKSKSADTGINAL